MSLNLIILILEYPLNRPENAYSYVVYCIIGILDNERLLNKNSIEWIQ